MQICVTDFSVIKIDSPTKGKSYFPFSIFVSSCQKMLTNIEMKEFLYQLYDLQRKVTATQENKTSDLIVEKSMLVVGNDTR